MPQFRLLPVTIFVASLMFAVRANDIWRGFMTIEIGSAAVAQSDDRPQPPTPGTAELPKTPPPSTPPAEAGDGPAGTFSASEVEVLKKLSQRREELEQRSRELDMREGLLKAAETRIDKKVDQLKELQASIDGLLKKHDAQEEAKMASLVKIYENMKPKDAARIFEQLDMRILLDVIERMSERRIAPIMAEMDPIKAKSVTAEMANRRQLPQPGSEG